MPLTQFSSPFSLHTLHSHESSKLPIYFFTLFLPLIEKIQNRLSPLNLSQLATEFSKILQMYEVDRILMCTSFHDETFENKHVTI